MTLVLALAFGASPASAQSRERAPQRHGSYRQAQPPRQGVSRDVRVRSARGPDRVGQADGRAHLARSGRVPRRTWLCARLLPLPATCGRIRRAATTGRVRFARLRLRRAASLRAAAARRRLLVGRYAITGPYYRPYYRPYYPLSVAVLLRLRWLGLSVQPSPAIPTCIRASTDYGPGWGYPYGPYGYGPYLWQQRLRGGSGRHPPADESEAGAGDRRTATTSATSTTSTACRSGWSWRRGRTRSKSRAEGFEPFALEVNILREQTIKYKGVLRPLP